MLVVIEIKEATMMLLLMLIAGMIIGNIIAQGGVYDIIARIDHWFDFL